MGDMTVVAISNDAWDTIEKNQDEFVQGIYDNGISARGRGRIFGTAFEVGNRSNYVKTHPTRHADIPQLVLAHRGMFTRIGYEPVRDLERRDLDLLEQQLKIARREIKLAQEAVNARRDELNA